jgi:hypothetical protein
VNVDYPELVQAFFAMFDSVDGSSMWKFIPNGTHRMHSSDGFFKNKIDSLFLRNANQNIIVFAGLGIAYALVRQVPKIL